MNRLAGSYRAALWCCIVGAAVAVAVTVLLRGVAGTRLLAEVVLDATTDGSSPQDFSFLLRTLEELARPMLFVSMLLTQGAVYVLVWRRTAWLQGYTAGVPRREVAAVLLVTLVLVAATAVLASVFDTGLGSETSWPEYVLVTFLAASAFVLVTRGLEAWDAAISGAPQDSSRRLFLGKGPAIVLGAAAVYVVGAQVLNTRSGGTQQGAHPGEPTLEVTPTDEFYAVSKNLIDPPRVSIDVWRLEVGGDVGAAAQFSIDDIRAMPAVEQYATFQCISNEVGGYLMGTAQWRGVLLRDLLARVQPLAAARHIWFESTDDYTENLPLEFAALDGVMLAYEMNGEPLTQEHGFPLRLVAPGKYGMKQPKWILRMMLRSEAEEGYWSRRGWDTDANIKTSSRIDVPATNDRVTNQNLRIQGVAFSGRHGIARVEVSTDGGTAWQEAVLKTPPLSQYSWVLWHFDWIGVPRSGDVRVMARATDGRGGMQTAEKALPYPSGSTGYPEVRVRAAGM